MVRAIKLVTRVILYFVGLTSMLCGVAGTHAVWADVSAEGGIGALVVSFLVLSFGVILLFAALGWSGLSE